MNTFRLNKHSNDEAWQAKFNKRPTNYKLKDGDEVVLLASTIGDGSYAKVTVAAGAKGIVKHARTPRTYREPGVTSCYFTNVDVTVDGNSFRVRVPHGALRIIKNGEQ